MNETLKVYLGDDHIGDLIQNNGQTLRFVYENSAKEDISLKMPRSNKIYYHKSVYPFFENLLPEGDILQLLAKANGVSQNNPFSLLSVIGEDCAGAIHLHIDKPVITTKLPRLISNSEFNKIINNTSDSRFNYQKGIRLSLAGAQDKTTVLIEEGSIYAPNFSHPSTHIVKFDSKQFSNILYNELFCTLLAGTIGLTTSQMELVTKEETPYLLIERFDRVKNTNGTKRLHQEDFCQLQAVVSKNKYQKEGGPSFKNVIDTINECSYRSASDILMIAKILVFNYLIGNCDYHSKNLSILHQARSLTPFYDLVSTIIYENVSTNMAMAINKKYEIKNIGKQDIIAEINKWGVRGDRMLGLILNDFKHIVKHAQELSKQATFKDKQETTSKIVDFIAKQFAKLQ